MKKTILCAASALSLALSLNAMAFAQDNEDSASDAEVIVVTGQRGALLNSIAQKRDADTITDVISSDDVGQFVDQNVGEAVRRVPGVSVANDQGEGRFVIIRGLDPNLNATKINGVNIPAPDGGERAVAVDVLDADVLESVTISKSLTPDMDGEGIGGSINIETLNAFKRDGLSFRAEVGGSYNELTEEVSPKLSASFTNILADDRLGVAASISYRERAMASENYEAGGDWVNDGDGLFNEEWEMRDYVVTRERLNAVFNLDYIASDTTELYLRTLYSDFSDQEFRNRIESKFEDGEIVSNNGNRVIFDASDVLEFDRDIKDRLETQRIYNVKLGGETELDTWEFDYSVAYSHAEEEEPNRIDTDFRLEVENDATALFGLDSSNPLAPQLIRSGTGNFINIDDPSAFEFNGLEFLNGITEDDEYALQFDAERDFDWGGNEAEFQFGFKYRSREKTRDVDLRVYDADLTADQFSQAIDYPLDEFGFGLNAGAIRSLFNSDFGTFAIFEEDGDIGALDLPASTIEDYTAEENILAGYAMATVDIDQLRLIGGVRVEQTEFSATADQFREDDPDGEIQQVSTSDEYTDFLPSITAIYDYSDDLILRAAYYRALSRPNFGQIVPAAELEFDGVDGNGRSIFEGDIGNPNLQRQVADNFDISAEYYIGNSGILSAAVFYKDIQDFIADQTVGGINNFGGVFVDDASTAINLDEASVMGIEFGYQQALTMLPAPWDGLILGANLTLTDGEAKLTEEENRVIPLPRQSETVGNLVFGYNKGRFDARLAYSYRSEYLDELGAGGGGAAEFTINGEDFDGDRYIDAHGQLDFSARVELNDSLKFYFDLINITDEPTEAFVTLNDGTKALLQFEEYGYTAAAGLKYRY
jgi:TonB-dependent receptor